LRLFSFRGYGLALAALALVVFGAIECPPFSHCRAFKTRLHKVQEKNLGPSDIVPDAKRIFSRYKNKTIFFLPKQFFFLVTRIFFLLQKNKQK